MILTGPSIKSAVSRGDIVVEPFDAADINPSSYIYHLAVSLLVLGRNGKSVRKISLTEKGYVLKPGKVYLGTTFERIGSDRYAMLLLGLPSTGKLGLFLNITADLGHIGSCSHWTLEMTVVKPLRIYPKMKIGQITFWQTDHSSSHRYEGRYHRDAHPVGNQDLTLIRRAT